MAREKYSTRKRAPQSTQPVRRQFKAVRVPLAVLSQCGFAPLVRETSPYRIPQASASREARFQIL